jgi:putative transcriptional regulator
VSSSPRPGDFLVADPRLTDPNFESSVVLICEHNEEGTLGLIINRPIDYTLQWQDDEQEWDSDLQIYWGGPVGQQGLLTLHRGAPDQTHEGITEVMPGLYFGGLNDELFQVDDTNETVRIYLGYAGWEVGQLDAELADGVWHLVGAKPEQVFSEQGPELWSELLVQLDKSFAWMSNVPEDPSLN